MISTEKLRQFKIRSSHYSKTDGNKNLWMLGIRHCVNGKTIKGNEQYGPTFAPTISPDTLRFQLAYAAAFGFKL